MTESKAKITNAITELHNTFPQWEDDAIIRQAYKRVGVTKDDFGDGFCPYKVLSRVRFIQGIEKSLYTNDFTDIPTSIRVAKAVNDNLPRLKKDFPNKEELEVLKIAYDMARGVLDNSDFETVEEETLYFEIYVDAENMEEFLEQLRKEYGEEYENVTYDFTDDKAQAKFFAKDKPVSGSSNVAEIGYERGKLRIFFKNGGGYEYPVPSSWYTEMLNAPSRGSYVWETLRGKTPGRVIDNPNKITPGGVGGSIVPYFKIKSAAMGSDEMRKSMTGFLKAARKGRAQVGGFPIRKMPKAKYKSFKKFLKKGAPRFSSEAQKTSKKPSARKSSAPRSFKKIVKKILAKKKKSESKETEVQKTDNSAIRDEIKRVRKALVNARKAKLDDVVLNALEQRIKTLEKSISDFTDFIVNYYNVIDDFVDDMQHFSGPITRAGTFEYNEGTKYKNFDNLTEVFNEISHLPSFDSHNEDQILGFAYNFSADPETQQIFSEGYTFDNIEETADVSLDSNTKLPVSIRFLDENEGTDNPEQHITELIHLAISVNQTDLDRCSSSGGSPCYVQFQDTKDFVNKKKLEQVGDLMPKNEKDKKKEPPKEKDEEDEEDKEDKKGKDEGKEKKKEKKISDQTKSDPPMDAEYQAEETKDFNNDMINIKKSEFEALSKQVSDMAKEHATRQKKQERLELTNIVNDFNDINQTYKIKSDFLKNADLKTMQILKSALVRHNENVDAQSQLFDSDFNVRANDLQANLQDMYNVPGAKK